jgi:hypothetical protein
MSAWLELRISQALCAWKSPMMAWVSLSWWRGIDYKVVKNSTAKCGECRGKKSHFEWR